jgi:hypothetical protein
MATFKPLKRLQRQHLDAIELLATGYNTAEVAESTGTKKGTITRWLSDPVFQEELQRQTAANHDALASAASDADNERRKRITDKWLTGYEKGLDCIIGILNDPKQTSTTKIRAFRALPTPDFLKIMEDHGGTPAKVIIEFREQHGL